MSKIQTSKGLFDFNNPMFDIEVIAHALSLINRYTGHTEYAYSVAEHSLLVCHIMEWMQEGNPIEGLLHDGTEAYLGDISTPLKAMLPDYRAIEMALDGKLRDQFNLPWKETETCKYADRIALAIEAPLCFKRKLDPLWNHWLTDEIKAEAKRYKRSKHWSQFVFGDDPALVEDDFLNYYEYLLEKDIAA